MNHQDTKCSLDLESRLLNIVKPKTFTRTLLSYWTLDISRRPRKFLSKLDPAKGWHDHRVDCLGSIKINKLTEIHFSTLVSVSSSRSFSPDAFFNWFSRPERMSGVIIWSNWYCGNIWVSPSWTCNWSLWGQYLNTNYTSHLIIK